MAKILTFMVLTSLVAVCQSQNTCVPLKGVSWSRHTLAQNLNFGWGRQGFMLIVAGLW